MLMKRLNYFALLLVVLMAMPVSSLQAKNKKDKTAKEQQMTTGAQESRCLGGAYVENSLSCYS